MKRLIILLLLVTGCASSSTKATDYCDSNWKGRYNSWQACYDRQLGQQNKGLKVFGGLIHGMGNGPRSNDREPTSCNSTVVGEQVYTNCN